MQAFYFPLFPILGCSLFGSGAGLNRRLEGADVSLSAWKKTFQGQETNFCEYGETIRPAILNERSGRHFATWGEFLLLKVSFIIGTVFILPSMSNVPLTSYHNMLICNTCNLITAEVPS